MKFLPRNFKRIVVMLGSACNMKCDYCIQRYQQPPALPSKLSADVLEFLDEIIDGSPENVDVRFYGGEPTLYFLQIKQILRHIGKGRCRFSILTNGKAVTDEMVDWFNQYGVLVSVSWDGGATTKTRHADVLKDNEALMRIDNLLVNAVISAKCYPIEFMEALRPYDEKYENLHGYHICAGMDFIVDSGIPKQELSYNIDCDRLYKDLLHLISESHEASERPSDAWPTRDLMIESYRHSIFQDKVAVPWTPCGSGFTMLNLDLAGNLYACHNTFHRIGDIYSDQMAIITGAIMSDPTIEDHETCKDCPARSWCSGGCRLARSSKKALESQCRLNRTVDRAFRDAAKKYGWKTTEGENSYGKSI